MKLKSFLIVGFSILLLLVSTKAQKPSVNLSKDTSKNGRAVIYIPTKEKSSENSDNFTLTKQELVDLLSNRNSIENSLSIFITALGVLFTIMAIVVAIVIFMQSRDFRNKLTEATDKYELIIKQFIESKREDLKLKEEELSKFISEYREKLESSQPEQESEIKEIISQLETKKDIVEKQLSNSVVNVNYVLPNYYQADVLGYSTNRYHKCSKCNFGFIVREPGFLDTAIYLNPISKNPLSNKVASCPKCGNVDLI